MKAKGSKGAAVKEREPVAPVESVAIPDPRTDPEGYKAFISAEAKRLGVRRAATVTADKVADAASAEGNLRTALAAWLDEQSKAGKPIKSFSVHGKPVAGVFTVSVRALRVRYRTADKQAIPQPEAKTTESVAPAA